MLFRSKRHNLTWIILVVVVEEEEVEVVDVLQQVGHTDGGVQLPRLVGGLGPLAVVPGDVQQAAGLGRHGRRVVLI